MNEDVDKIVNDLKARGVFDEFRKECLSSVDTRPAFAGLRHKIDITCESFLKDQIWNPNANKNQLRDGLRQKLNSEGLGNTIGHLVDQVVELKASTYMLSRIDKHVQDYLGIKIEEPLLRVEDNILVWPESEKIEVKKEENDGNEKWSKENWNEVNNTTTTENKPNPSLSPSTVSSHSLSPPTPEPITDGGSEDSFPPAPSPTSLISGENSKSSQHYFDESTSKSPENKTKNDIWNQLSKEGKQSADEPKPEPLDWGTTTSPPPERPFAHLGSFSADLTKPTGTNEALPPTIKSEPKSPELLPSSSSSVPLLSNKSKEESREDNSEIEESKGKSDPIVSDMLSDVSSAHTSDLSDFDDAMSISSVEEAEDMKQEMNDVEGKVVQSEVKIDTEIKIKRENISASQVNEEIETIKVEDSGTIIKDQKLNEDETTEHVKHQMEDQVVNKVADKVIDENKNRTRIETKKRKEPEKEPDPWGDEMVQVKPKFEIIKSTPEAPVFDIRARGKEAICLTPVKVLETPSTTKTPISTKELKSTTIKSEKISDSNGDEFVIPKIKREPKSRDQSPPSASTRTDPLPPPPSTSSSLITPNSFSSRTNEESRSKRNSRDSIKKKSDLSSSQRYDEADLYKPRPSIPGSRRHRSSK
ncbi:biorientation of chromosomes in cell division protein 1-like 1 isoform X1 [Panonychus citri]|uniref:biorientation of chromosomes in cell division protein 1-like 1 isoform X1 n=1 Tax=Panonychus citri TaxID=50023 RepID=UPI002307B8F3|nr:biorientation of chromosomes in cell division protein 1-like 1 isoform X1 [Panonychus citri]